MVVFIGVYHCILKVYFLGTQLLFEFSEIIKNISILEKLLDNLLEISSTKARFAKTDKVVVEIGNAETELCLGPNQLQNGPLSLLQLLGE